MKDDILISRMNQLTVDMEGHMPSMKQSTRPLPESRKCVDEPELYFEEPAKVPLGKTSLSYAEKFLMQHQHAPKDYTAKVIAQEYSLDRRQVQQVLKYFQTMSMHIPDEILKKNPKFLDALGQNKGAASVRLLERIKNLLPSAAVDNKTLNEDKQIDEEDLDKIKVR